MRVPDWRALGLPDSTLSEPVQEGDRLVLWLPGDRDDRFQYWERIATPPRGQVTVRHGIGSLTAQSIRARQQLSSRFGRWLTGWRRSEGQTWLLPTGEEVGQCGDRQNDLLLLWSDLGTGPLDEARIQAQWPQGQNLRQLGENLFVITAAVASAEQASTPAKPQGIPREMAERSLTAARQSGDRRLEATALIDLGSACFQDGDTQQAAALFEQALAIAHQSGDGSRAGDALGNLGLVLLASNQAARALALFEQELAHARAANDRFLEKLALEHVAKAHEGLGDRTTALGVAAQALELARALGDRQHEGTLLWFLSMQHAELGQRDQVTVYASAAVALFTAMGHPQAGAYASHLGSYLGEAASTESLIVANAAAAPATVEGPSVFQMGLSAAKAAARFVGGGLQVVPADIHKQRLQACGSCVHHTGLRCRLCGCFTQAKAWLPHEICPAGKWPT